jgi:hypothetical protein
VAELDNARVVVLSISSVCVSHITVLIGVCVLSCSIPIQYHGVCARVAPQRGMGERDHSVHEESGETHREGCLRID